MVQKILFNKYCKRGKLVEIKSSKNKEFLIWEFKDDKDNKVVGFTPVSIYFGGKAHLWYSLLTGYFLPFSYNLNFDNIKGKECYLVLDVKGVVRDVLPISTEKKQTSTPITPATEQNVIGQDEELFK